MSSPIPGELTRGRLAGRILFAIKRGGCLRPDVLLAATGSGPVVVKDWSARPRPVRATLGRIAVGREARAHRRLDGLGCVPRLLGRLDAFALVLEYRAGTRISRRRPWIFHSGFAADLAGAVAEIHARGVIHLDLAHRGNVGADADGRPVVFDLGAALCLRPDRPVGRWLFRALALADRRALRKWGRELGASTQAFGSPGSWTSEGSRPYLLRSASPRCALRAAALRLRRAFRNVGCGGAGSAYPRSVVGKPRNYCGWRSGSLFASEARQRLARSEP